MNSAQINRRRLVVCLALVGAPIPFAIARDITAAELTPMYVWSESDVRPGSVSGEVVRTWTGGGGVPWVGGGTNWSPVGIPTAGDDLVFGTLKAGNYSVVQDLPITYNDLTVNRSLATEVLNFDGHYNGSSFRVVKGVVNVTTPIFGVSTPGATNALSSIVVGSGAGNVANVTFSGVPGRYYDARVGVNGATGTLQITGANTSLVPFTRNTSDSVFGGTADAANATILVDAATVEAWVITTGVRGSTRFINNAQVSSVPTPTGVGQVQVGSPDASNVSLEVSGSADLRVVGQDAILLIGSGVGAVTDTKILSGGSVVSDLVVTGASSGDGTAASTNTFTLSGAGSTVTTTEAFDTNGGYRFADPRRGSTTVNVLDGGRLFTPRFDSNAADRPSGSGATSNTTLKIDGMNSLLQARTDLGGVFVSSLGDYTIDQITVSNYGKIDAAQMALGVGVGASSTMNLSTAARVTADLFEMARPARAGGATTATLNVDSGAGLVTANLITSRSLTAVSTITVRGGGSSIDSTGVALLGGVTTDVTGGGSTNFTLSGGGAATFAALQAGSASAAGKGAGYTGTQLTVTGMGSRLLLRGNGGSTPQATDLAANLVLSAKANTVSTLTISNGGNVTLLDNSDNPNLDGSIAMSAADNATSTLVVDGPESTLDAGKLITMAETAPVQPFANAAATLTVRNGAFVAVYENGADPASGNVQMAIRPGTNLNATINVGGGTALEDVDSSLSVDGTLFVGGSGDAANPVPGGRATVNLYNGALAAGAVAVYANSRINQNGGRLMTDNLMVLGGRIDMNSTAPVTVELGTLSVSNGGVINVGRGGGVVYYSTAGGSPSEVGVVRQLILNASNGGAWNGSNGITSSLLSAANSQYAIGYADIAAASIPSMLDLDFPAGTEGVAFRYTLRGDTNLDGAVRFDDLLKLAQNYEKASGAHWYQGDSNYSGTINFDDLLLLSQTYGSSLLESGQLSVDATLAAQFDSDWAMARSMVPEPASLSMLAGTLSLLGSRRRRN